MKLYFGLRSYQVEPQLWGGVEGCEHVWGDITPGDNRGGSGTYNGRNGAGEGYARHEARGQFCRLCPAWLGHLGLEKLPWCEASLQGRDCDDHCYLGHLLQVADGVWRVLREDGVLWWVHGDGYVSHKPRKNAVHRQSQDYGDQSPAFHAAQQAVDLRRSSLGLKDKNLLMLPARFSIAMQSRGWILRSEIPWTKRNAMPSSVEDRPSMSHETVFLFSKGPHYFYDPDAVRQAHVRQWDQHNGGTMAHAKGNGSGEARYLFGSSLNHAGAYPLPNPAGRNRRTGDWWFESLDTLIADTEAWLAHAKQVRENGGLLLSPEGEPLGLNVNPQPTKLAHFACFPERLVEPMILSSTSQYGACSRCLSPWGRVVAQETVREHGGTRPMDKTPLNVVRAGWRNGGPETSTLAWFPSCACGGYRLIPLPRIGPSPTHAAYWQARQAQIEALWPAVEPCVVLDPFLGSGTTAVVSRHLGRRAIGVELSPAYLALAQQRLHADLPLFTEDPTPTNGSPGPQTSLTFDT